MNQMVKQPAIVTASDTSYGINNFSYNILCIIIYEALSDACSLCSMLHHSQLEVLTKCLIHQFCDNQTLSFRFCSCPVSSIFYNHYQMKVQLCWSYYHVNWHILYQCGTYNGALTKTGILNMLSYVPRHWVMSTPWLAASRLLCFIKTAEVSQFQ